MSFSLDWGLTHAFICLIHFFTFSWQYKILRGLELVPVPCPCAIIPL
uniref:Uncharacterized protein n=1 Tax=Anguilla anguilla TaxID=7936 RepID=A0A0E9R288_ANGAN